MPYVTTLPDGSLGVIRLKGMNPEGELARTLFELSRDGTDLESLFDPKTHTLDAIAAGLPGHFPMSCRECNETDLPNNRNFRDAWEATETAVRVNMPSARLIHMDRIRAVRNKEFDRLELDRHQLSAVASGDTFTASEIEAQKQVLRDLPHTFDLSSGNTPASLEALWPSVLPAR